MHHLLEPLARPLTIVALTGVFYVAHIAVMDWIRLVAG